MHYHSRPSAVSFGTGHRLLLLVLLIAGIVSVLPKDSLAQPSGDVNDPLSRPEFNRVTSIKFVGNDSLSSDELYLAIATKVPSWYDHTIHDYISSSLGFTYQSVDLDQLNQDTNNLNLYYKDHGFLQAHSTYQIFPDSAQLRKYHIYLDSARRYKLRARKTSLGVEPPVVDYSVVFTIKEGDPSYIAGVTFEGLEKLPEEFQPELTQNSLIKVKSRWSLPTAVREVERLGAIMVEHGYPFFRHDSIIIQFKPSTHSIFVNVMYIPGHRYKFGPVRIEYDTSSPEHSHVTESVIRSQLYFQQGEWFNQSEVVRSEQALYKLNTFEIVQMSLDTTVVHSIADSLRDSVELPVVINLRMKKKAEALIGPFGGTGSHGFVFGLTAGYSNRNFSGSADALLVAGSYQFFPTSQGRWSGSVDYTIPYIGVPHLPLTIGASVVYQSESGIFSEQSISLHGGVNYSFGTLAYRMLLAPDMTFQLVSNVVVSNDSAIKANLPRTQLNFIPSVNFQIDHTNDFLEPTSGFLFGTSFELGLPIVLGTLQSSNYAKVAPQFKYFADLTSTGRAIFATRLHVGYIDLFDPANPYRRTPIERRFSAGGQNSIRGWGAQSLIVTQDPHYDIVQEAAFSLLEFSAEVRLAPFYYEAEYTTMQKLLSPLHIALFADAGNAWARDVTPSGKDIAIAVGIGIRYHTLVGALRFDLGFKLFDPSGSFVKGEDITLPTSVGAWLWQRPPGTGLWNIMAIQFALGEPF